jgi:signal transduction histidine kinase
MSAAPQFQIQQKADALFLSNAPLPGMAWSASYVARNHDLWVGGDRAVGRLRDGKWQTFSSSDKTTPEGAVAFAEIGDGKIWCATPNKIWEFDGDTWTARRVGFDHINCLLHGRDGSMWIGCNNGLHRFVHDAWLVNSSEDGLPANAIRALAEDVRGRVWANTSQGLAVYHPEADRDAPEVFIAKPRDAKILEGGAINLAFRGQDKWRHTATDRLLFSCRLDEKEWSDFDLEPRTSLVDLTAGTHTFQVRAMDRNANISRNSARYEFAVALPWYKEPRLVIISTAGLVLAVFFAALAWNRHRRLALSYAEIERKIAERTQELELAHRELLHSQKMNALGTLAAGIAHDFNNILSIIEGSAEIIEDNLHDPDKVRARAGRIRTMVKQGGGIVKAMLGFTRSSGAPVPSDLNAIVEGTVTLLGERFQRQAALRFECDPNLPVVVVSREFVQQILLNLLFNAAEAVTERKEIVIKSWLAEKLPDRLVLKPVEAGPYLCFSVQDFGCGIPAQNLARIFEPFYTTKSLSSRRGIGLGLSMVYELARKMEAGLAVESVVARGSTFTLVIPKQGRRPEEAGGSNGNGERGRAPAGDDIPLALSSPPRARAESGVTPTPSITGRQTAEEG